MDGLKKDLDLKNISLQDFDVYSYRYEMNKIRSLNDQYIRSINGKKFECTPPIFFFFTTLNILIKIYLII